MTKLQSDKKQSNQLVMPSHLRMLLLSGIRTTLLWLTYKTIWRFEFYSRQQEEQSFLVKCLKYSFKYISWSHLENWYFTWQIEIFFSLMYARSRGCMKLYWILKTTDYLGMHEPSANLQRGEASVWALLSLFFCDPFITPLSWFLISQWWGGKITELGVRGVKFHLTTQNNN